MWIGFRLRSTDFIFFCQKRDTLPGEKREVGVDVPLSSVRDIDNGLKRREDRNKSYPQFPSHKVDLRVPGGRGASVKWLSLPLNGPFNSPLNAQDQEDANAT